MGRGLSPLQQQILVAAWEKEQGPWAAYPLFTHELCVRLWHWPVTQWHYVGKFEIENGLYFSRQVIGESRYNSVMVSLCRSTQRLHRRGLITYHRLGGVGLPEQGRQTAGQLVGQSTAADTG